MLGGDGGEGDGDPLYTFVVTFPRPTAVYLVVYVVPTLPSGMHTYNGIVAPTPILPLQFADAKAKTPNPDDATVTCSFAK